MIEVQNILVEHEGVLHTLSLCRHCDIPILFLATHAVVPRLALGRGCDISCPDHEVAEVLALVSLEREALDHGAEDRKNLWLSDGFCTVLSVTMGRPAVLHYCLPR